MKTLLKLFVFISLFFITSIYFLPKEGLYNLFEEKLSKQNIVISDELREEKIFSLDLNHMNIYYDGIDSALVKSTTISTYLFLSKVKIRDIKVSDSFKNMIPSKIKNIKLVHSFLDFTKVSISLNGDFGEFIGKYLILDNKVVGELKPSKIMKSKYRNILRQFKLKEGRYYYEYKL